MAATDTSGGSRVVWETCREQGCIGARLAEAQVCWAHADDGCFDDACSRLQADGHLDGRGVRFRPELLDGVLAALPSGTSGRTVLASLDLSRATIPAGAALSGMTVRGPARLAHTVFEAVVLDDVVFEGLVSFGWSVFGGRAVLRHAHVGGSLHLSHAVVGADLVLADVTVVGDVLCDHVDARGELVMSPLWCSGDVSFVGTTFDAARRLGPFRAGGCVHLDGTVWQQRPLVDVSARQVSCRQSRFLAGVQLRVRGDPDGPQGTDGAAPVEVVLDDALLAHPSVVTDAPRFRELDGGPGTGSVPAGTNDAVRPQVISLARADVGGLTLSRMDVRRCRFAAAHNVDRLRLDDVRFAAAPGRWRTQRQVVAEEVRWRTRHARGRRHRRAWAQLADWADGYEPALLHPTQVASIYRDLRKGREDNLDEPGAADFYYGEMEMRRRSARRRHAGIGSLSAGRRGWPEQAILTLYWLLSGYGLRAWRALTSFVALVGLGAVALHRWGFDGAGGSASGLPGDPSAWATAVVVSLQASTPVFADVDAPLTTTGHMLDVGLGLTAPVLLGLAVLSIRGRVKR